VTAAGAVTGIEARIAGAPISWGVCEVPGWGWQYDAGQAGEVSYTEAVRDGIYRPLGLGDIDIAAIVSTLEAAGYQGWYVLEQDTVLDGEPAAGEPGPVADVRTSVGYLRSLGASDEVAQSLGSSR